MNEVEWIRSLDRTPIHVPEIDVTNGVIRSIEAGRSGDDRVFRFAAVAAVVMGVSALTWSMTGRQSPENPLVGFDEAIQLVLR